MSPTEVTSTRNNHFYGLSSVLPKRSSKNLNSPNIAVRTGYSNFTPTRLTSACRYICTRVLACILGTSLSRISWKCHYISFSAITRGPTPTGRATAYRCKSCDEVPIIPKMHRLNPGWAVFWDVDGYALESHPYLSDRVTSICLRAVSQFVPSRGGRTFNLQDYIVGRGLTRASDGCISTCLSCIAATGIYRALCLNM